MKHFASTYFFFLSFHFRFSFCVRPARGQHLVDRVRAAAVGARQSVLSPFVSQPWRVGF